MKLVFATLAIVEAGAAQEVPATWDRDRSFRTGSACAMVQLHGPGGKGRARTVVMARMCRAGCVSRMGFGVIQ